MQSAILNNMFRVGLRLIVSIVFMPLAFLLTSCFNSNSALPQSSLPAPTNECTDDDCVTLSSPDADGVVTVTASTGTVPNNALVIIEVESTSSSLSPPVQAVVKQATTVCTADIPICSEVFSTTEAFTGQCQLTAEDDGSFTLRLKVDLDKQLRIVYLDPDNDCSEVEALTGVTLQEIIIDTLYQVPVEATALSVARTDSSDEFYVFGQSAEGLAGVVRVSSAGDEEDTPAMTFLELSNVDGAITDGEVVIESQDVAAQVVIWTTVAQVGIELIGRDDIEPTIVQMTGMSTSGDGVSEANLQATKMVKQTNFNYRAQVDDSGDLVSNRFNCMPHEINSSFLNAVSVDRIFFARPIENELDRFVPLAVMDVPVTGLDDEGFTWSPQARHISLSGLFANLPGTLMLNSVIDMAYEPNKHTISLLLQFVEESDNSLVYYLAEIPASRHFCGTDLISSADADTRLIRLDGDFSEFGHLAVAVVNEEDWVLLPIMDPQATILSRNGAIEDSVTTVSLDKTFASGTFQFIIDQQETADGYFMAGIGSASNLVLFDVTSDDIGIRLTEIASTIFVGLNPLELIPVGDNHLAIVSRGLSNDGNSGLRIIERDDILSILEQAD